MEGNEQWVEIRCPRTGEPMFANLVSGECLWEAPSGASVRESTNNQWWELYDQTKGKHYYHNATTNKTVWRKPQGAEILSLTKLQEISGPKSKDALNKKVNGACVKLQVMGDKPAQQEAAAIDSAEGRMSPPRHVPPQPTKRSGHTPPHTRDTLERNSPGSDPSVRPPSTSISPFSIQQQNSLKLNKQGRIPPPVAHKPATLKRGAAPGTMGGLVSLNISSRGEDTPDSTTTDGREPDKFTSPPAPPPPINMPKPFNNGVSHSPVRTSKHMSASVESLSNLDSDENVFDSPVTDKSAIHEKLKQNRQETRYQSFHDFSAPSKFSEIRNKTLPVRSLDDESGLTNPTTNCNDNGMTNNNKQPPDLLYLPSELPNVPRRRSSVTDTEFLPHVRRRINSGPSHNQSVPTNSESVYENVEQGKYWNNLKARESLKESSSITPPPRHHRTKSSPSTSSAPQLPQYENYEITRLPHANSPTVPPRGAQYENLQLQKEEETDNYYSGPWTRPRSSQASQVQEIDDILRETERLCEDLLISPPAAMDYDRFGDEVSAVPEAVYEGWDEGANSNNEVLRDGHGREIESEYYEPGQRDDVRERYRKGVPDQRYQDYCQDQLQPEYQHDYDNYYCQQVENDYNDSQYDYTEQLKERYEHEHGYVPFEANYQPIVDEYDYTEMPETPENRELESKSSEPYQQPGYENIERLCQELDRQPSYKNMDVYPLNPPNDSDYPDLEYAEGCSPEHPTSDDTTLGRYKDSPFFPADHKPKQLRKSNSMSTYEDVVLASRNRSRYENIESIRRPVRPTPARPAPAPPRSAAYVEVVMIFPGQVQLTDIEEHPTSSSSFRARGGSGSRLKRPEIDQSRSLSDDEYIQKRLSKSHDIDVEPVSRCLSEDEHYEDFVGKMFRKLTRPFSQSYTEGTRRPTVTEEPQQRRHSTEIISPRHNDKNNKKGAFKSKMSTNRAPTSPPHHNPEFAIFEKTELNRPSIYLGLKKVSIATMLAYSKDKIQKPLFFTRDKELRKRAVELFKTLQNYMGDTRRGKGYSDKERLKAASELTHMGWQKPAFRDELYMQIIKQTTANDKEKSLEHGWKLLSVYLYYFPPSMKFKNYLEGYLYKNKEANSESDKYRGQVPVGAYADYCHDRLEKMIVRGAKPGGLKEPTLDEIRHAMKLPLKKSMFGATLEEVMDLQKDSHPTHHLPWVLTLLADKIIEFNGLEMEGIFRVPGDIDEVNALKVALDSGDHVKNFGTQDPSVCASLLKEWLRDLYDPIIPESLYNQCIEYCDHAQWTPNVIKDLPDIHRLVVTYIIRFLQKFAEKENVPKTKMTTDNLAMVFAPNLLRCPSDDPQIIYENTLKQMTFVKTLIVNLDTAYMDSVV